MITKSQIAWINENLPIEQYLEELEVDLPPSGKVFCPFHHNVNTPAAKVFLSEESGNGGRLYCYAERRSYTTFDVIKRLGYQDNEIHAMVPREFWYEVENAKPVEQMKIPIVDREARDAVQGGAFGVLHQLDIMWNNPKKFKCRSL
jgi:hypothetical protein